MIHTRHINFVYHNSVNESARRKFHFYLNSRRKSRSYVEGGLGGLPISPRSLPPGMLLLANTLSGEERGRNSCFYRLWHCNPRLILKRPKAYGAAQKSEFSQLRLKQTQKHLSLTVNTDTAVYAWIVFLR